MKLRKDGLKRIVSSLLVFVMVFSIIIPSTGMQGVAEAAIGSGEELNTVIDLNLRSKENDRAAPVVYVPRGKTVEFLEEAENDYFKLEYKGKTGYAHRSDVTAYYGEGNFGKISKAKLKEEGNNKKYKAIKDDVLRSKDVKNSLPTDLVERGDEVTHKGTTENDYFLVEKDGKEGYIYRGDVTSLHNFDKGGVFDKTSTKKEKISEKLAVIRDDVLRAKPRADAGTTAILERGSTVTYVGTTDNNWFHVKDINENQGYIYRGYVTAGKIEIPEDPKPEMPVEAKEQLDKNLKYIHEKIENPSFGTGAGEWSILSLARGGYDAPEEYYDLYHDNVEKAVKESMKDGKLHRAKSTEHSRLILGFSSIGRDITDVAGYDIREALADFDYSTGQGINGPIFALIALDSKDYEIPEVEGVKNESTREKFIDYILEKEITQENGDIGGWALHGNVPDPDITGMAIQGLTPYYEKNEDVKVAIDRGIEWLSKAQKDDGGYSSWGSENIESASQVVVALTGLGIDPHGDSRFIKNGNSVIDNLLTFSVETGGFMHVKPGGNTGGGGAAGKVDGMATDQGTYALVAYDRFVNGQNRLYDMTDVKVKPNPESAQTVYVTVENTTFTEAEGAPWDGKLLDMYPVEIETEAMMEAVEKALAENSYQAEGIKSNYITSIHGLSALQEGSGEQSGWMSTINGWFANVGADDITVEDGDVIDFMFSKNYGGDIGSKWGDNSTFLKGIEFDSGELTEEFDKNQTEYTLVLPEGTNDLVVNLTAENKNFQVRTYLDQYTPDSKGYKLTRGIPVENGSKVIIGVGDPAWPSMNEGAEGTIYTINVEIKTK